MSSTLLSWVLAASSTLAPGRTHDALAEAIVARVEAEAPLFRGDVDRKKTAGLLVAMAFRESSLRANAVGDKRGGKPTSFCAFQINLPWGHKTAEGWTGEDLLDDPQKCVTTALHMVRTSMQVCPDHPLAWYAEGPSGCKSARAQRISRDRLAVGKYLVRTVATPRDDKAPDGKPHDDKDGKSASLGGGGGVALTSRRATDEP
jgi:hypothetical protein